MDGDGAAKLLDAAAVSRSVSALSEIESTRVRDVTLVVFWRGGLAMLRVHGWTQVTTYARLRRKLWRLNADRNACLGTTPLWYATIRDAC
jgi:hypothetical protein